MIAHADAREFGIENKLRKTRIKYFLVQKAAESPFAMSNDESSMHGEGDRNRSCFSQLVA
jgi:hypothetical protein